MILDRYASNTIGQQFLISIPLLLENSYVLPIIIGALKLPYISIDCSGDRIENQRRGLNKETEMADYTNLPFLLKLRLESVIGTGIIIFPFYFNPGRITA
jgi:hypothetical protein